MQKLIGVLMHSYSIESEVVRLRRARWRHRYYDAMTPYVFLIVGIVSLLFFIGYEVNLLASIGSLLGLYCLYRVTVHHFDEREQTVFDTRLNCPSCRKHIPAFEPWMCPNCDEVRNVPREVAIIEARNRTLSEDEFTGGFPAYSFIYRCQICANVATTYKCHHCGELIALSGHPNPARFVYNPLRLPDGVFVKVDEDLKSEVDKIKREGESEHREIRDAERKFDLNDRYLDLKEDRKKHYKRKVDASQMTEEEAQKRLRIDILYIERRMTFP